VERAGHYHGAFGGVGLADDRDEVLPLELAAQAGAQELVVVDDESPDHCAAPSTRVARVPPPGRGPSWSPPPNRSASRRHRVRPTPFPATYRSAAASPAPSAQRGVRVEVRERALKQHVARAGDRVALVHCPRVLVVHRIGERIVELVECQRDRAIVVGRALQYRESDLQLGEREFCDAP
jgi:hypothetical protein